MKLPCSTLSRRTTQIIPLVSFLAFVLFVFATTLIFGGIANWYYLVVLLFPIVITSMAIYMLKKSR